MLCDPCAAGNGRDDADNLRVRPLADGGEPVQLAHKTSAHDRLVHKLVAQAELAAGVQHRHHCARARAARRAVDHARPRLRLPPLELSVGHDHDVTCPESAVGGALEWSSEAKDVGPRVVEFGVLYGMLLARRHLDHLAKSHDLAPVRRLKAQPD